MSSLVTITIMLSDDFATKASDIEACKVALRSTITDPRDDRETLGFEKCPKVDGTCKWITNNETYISWLNPSSRLLWLSGGLVR